MSTFQITFSTSSFTHSTKLAVCFEDESIPRYSEKAATERCQKLPPCRWDSSVESGRHKSVNVWIWANYCTWSPLTVVAAAFVTEIARGTVIEEVLAHNAEHGEPEEIEFHALVRCENIKSLVERIQGWKV
jgi:hypothetical protein